MKDNIPDMLPISTPIAYYSNDFFNTKKGTSSVCCYFHASNRGWTFPIGMHAHEFFEINLVVGGKGIHYFNNEKVNIEIGDVFILPPNFEHGYYEIYDLEIFHILLNKSFFALYEKTLKNMDGYVSLFNIEPTLRSSQVNNTFLRLSKTQFNDIFKDINYLMEYTENTVYHANIQAAYVFSIICKFCNFYHTSLVSKQSEQAKTSYAPMIVFAIEFMKKNLSQKLTIEMIAQELHISESTFKRYFHEITDVTPMEYLINLRIQQSKKMIRTTNKSITFIAYECGFYDSSHFLRLFKKSEGITPSEYKKLQIEKNNQ